MKIIIKLMDNIFKECCLICDKACHGKIEFLEGDCQCSFTCHTDCWQNYILDKKQCPNCSKSIVSNYPPQDNYQFRLITIALLFASSIIITILIKF